MAKPQPRVPAIYRDQFDPAREFVVRRGFRCNGVDLRAGKPFDKRSVTLRRLKGLFHSGQIAFPDFKHTLRSAERQTPTKPRAIGPERWIEHRGFGKYFVIVAGEPQGESMTKDAAKASGLEVRSRPRANRAA